MFQKFRVCCCAVALCLLSFVIGPADVYGQQPEATQLPDPEVLEQGPIHEAFAEPLALDAQAAAITPRQPPEPIEELPPEYQPEGRNVQWIPGYFMWQADRDDFVWVSGLYRDVPPGRTWVPGAWQEVEVGYQWAAGFWSQGDLKELNYLPTPPDTLEQGPSSPIPGDNYLWAPGCWQWRDDGYAWQPGYWYEAQPDWVWVPSHYSYSSRGCVYVGGYWDFPFARRGLLYAPVYWRRGVHLHVGHYYRPRHVLNTALVVASLFVDHHHRYHFGYQGIGRHTDWLHRWGHGHGRHGGKRYHDPQWAHDQWNQRRGRGDSDRHRGTADRGHEGRDRLVSDVNRWDSQRRSDMKLRHQGNAEQLAQRKRTEQFRQHSQRRAGTKGKTQNQTAGTGQIRRRSEVARSDARIGGGANAERKTQLGNQAQTRRQGNRSRGNNQVQGDVGGSTAGSARSERRARGDGESAVGSKRREAISDRVEAADRLRRGSGRGQTTVRRQSGGVAQQRNNVQQGNNTQQRSHVQRRNPTYQGSGAFGNVAPRQDGSTMRSRSPQRRQSFSPSGSGQRSSRSFQRSGDGGGGSSFRSRGRGGDSGGGGHGGGGGRGGGRGGGGGSRGRGGRSR